jgi:hypothetical protein
LVGHLPSFFDIIRLTSRTEETEPRSGMGNGDHYSQAKHQAVIALDMAEWKELIDLFDIQEPMIRHREEEQHTNVGKKGWYA